jgi:hypothetical protein
LRFLKMSIVYEPSAVLRSCIILHNPALPQDIVFKWIYGKTIILHFLSCEQLSEEQGIFVETALKLDNWLKDRGLSSTSLREVQRLGPASVRAKEAALAALDQLTKSGVLVCVSRGERTNWCRAGSEPAPRVRAKAAAVCDVSKAPAATVCDVSLARARIVSGGLAVGASKMPDTPAKPDKTARFDKPSATVAIDKTVSALAVAKPTAAYALDTYRLPVSYRTPWLDFCQHAPAPLVSGAIAFLKTNNFWALDSLVCNEWDPVQIFGRGGLLWHVDGREPRRVDRLGVVFATGEPFPNPDWRSWC